MKKPVAMLFVLAELVPVGHGQDPKAASIPFTLTWSEGKCLGCKNAAWLGEIQFVSRSQVWGVGFKDELNAVNTIVVHSADGGRTWREVPQSQQYTDPDGQLAFSFPDAAHGWIATWGNLAGEPEMISTRDGGLRWQDVSQQFLQGCRWLMTPEGMEPWPTGFFVRMTEAVLGWEPRSRISALSIAWSS